jgi:hypothetical protein
MPLSSGMYKITSQTASNWMNQTVLMGPKQIHFQKVIIFSLEGTLSMHRNNRKNSIFFPIYSYHLCGRHCLFSSLYVYTKQILQKCNNSRDCRNVLCSTIFPHSTRYQWPSGVRRRTWSLGSRDRVFESRLRHGCLFSSIHHHCHPIIYGYLV